MIEGCDVDNTASVEVEKKNSILHWDLSCGESISTAHRLQACGPCVGICSLVEDLGNCIIHDFVVAENEELLVLLQQLLHILLHRFHLPPTSSLRFKLHIFLLDILLTLDLKA